MTKFYSDQYRLLHMRYIIKNAYAIDMDTFSRDERKFFTESIFREFQDTIIWLTAIKHIKFSESFLREMIMNNVIPEGVIFHEIPQYQKLSEKFIDEFNSDLSWTLISAYQKLSEPFIERYQDKIDWPLIFQYQKLSPEFNEKYKNRLTKMYK